MLIIILGLQKSAYSEEFVGDITRFSPSVGQPLFPVGNINVFKQYEIGFDESFEVGKKVDIGFATFGGGFSAVAAAHLGFEFGVCFGGNADYDLAFKPRISVPDSIPYEFPLTLHVDEGLMADSRFTTVFPPLGQAYADLIFDIELGAEFEACVFGCFGVTLFSLKTAALTDVTFMSIPVFEVVPENALKESIEHLLTKLIAKRLRCDPTIKRLDPEGKKHYSTIELASWNRSKDSENQFRLLNVFGTRKEKADRDKRLGRVANFLKEPYLEYGGNIEIGGAGTTFSADPEKDEITKTAGELNFEDNDPVVLLGSDLPGGLSEKKVYYVVGEGDTFKLARRSGGSPVDITGESGKGGSIRKNKTHKPGSPKGDTGAWGKISIAAPTVSTDSSVSEVDDLVRKFTAVSDSTLVMEPKVSLESGLQGFQNDLKVRVKKGSLLPDGLNPACVYYVANADSSGLKFQLATKVGGDPVDFSTGAGEISRSAEFNSTSGLSSSGAEDVAAVTIDVVELVNENVFSGFSPAKGVTLGINGEVDFTIAKLYYKLLSLEVGPAIQLQTDFKMSWDVIVDDMLFYRAGTMQPALVRFPSKLDQAGESDFSSLKAGFPGQVFHLASVGHHALPEISLLNGEAVEVKILYHVAPKLKTTVSAPIFGRVKYEALEVGAEISKIGGVSLGPVVEGEKKFKLGEFTAYDGDPFPLNTGQVVPRTDFKQSEDLDRYEVILVDTLDPANDPMPLTGCAEVFLIRTGTGETANPVSEWELRIFDVEGELMNKRSGRLGSGLLSQATIAELEEEFDTNFYNKSAAQKAKILKALTNQAGHSPGVMKFKLQADGPADYHWQPFTSYDANSESDFRVNDPSKRVGTYDVEKDHDVTYNTEIDEVKDRRDSVPSSPFGDLVARWSFNNATVADSVAGRGGTLLGPATLTNAVDVPPNQEAGGALDLGGAGGAFRVDGAFLNAITEGDTVTVMYWQKLRRDPGFHTNIKFESPGSITTGGPGDARGLSVHTPWADDRIYFDTVGCCDTGKSRIFSDPITNVDWTKWNHFAFVRNHQYKAIYVNGVQIAEGVNSEPLPTDITNLWIGSALNGAESVDGWMDEVRIYRKALGGYKGYSNEGPTGYWESGYLDTDNKFNAFEASAWSVVNGTGAYRLSDGLYMDPLIAVPTDDKRPTRRWVSPGGHVEVNWGVSMRPRRGNGVSPVKGIIQLEGEQREYGESNGVRATLRLNGAPLATRTLGEAPTLKPADSGMAFRYEVVGGTNGFDPAWAGFRLWNTGSEVITRCEMTVPPLGRASLHGSRFGENITLNPGEFVDLGSINFYSVLPGGDFFPDKRVNSDYRRILFNNGDPDNAVVKVTGAGGGETSITLPDSQGRLVRAYRFESHSVKFSEIIDPNGFFFGSHTLNLTLKAGDVLDLVLDARDLFPNYNSYLDDAALYLDVDVRDHEWATPPESPTNWVEYLSRSAPHLPNAYPGGSYDGHGAATNLATIDKIGLAPFPSLTTSKVVDFLEVKKDAQLNFSPPDDGEAKLEVHRGTIANAGTIDVFQDPHNFGEASMILGGPKTSSRPEGSKTSLTGKGTVNLRGSTLAAYGAGAGSQMPIGFVNYNKIVGYGNAMNLLDTHPNARSSIENMGNIRAQGSDLEISAHRFINKGGLLAKGLGGGWAAGRLHCRGEQFANRLGGYVGADGKNALLFLKFDEGANAGHIYASNGGAVLLGGESPNNWSAGIGELSEQQGTFLADNGTIGLAAPIHVTGGSFVIRNGSELEIDDYYSAGSGDSFFTGSTLEIGNFDPDTIHSRTGFLSLKAPSNYRFTGVSVRNFGELHILTDGASADFVDSRLFENHGAIRVGPGSSLRFREIFDRTVDENADEASKKFPGVANATGETLLGGTWDIFGELLIDGAVITKIGADVEADTTYGVSEEEDDGKISSQEIVDGSGSTATACALSLCQPAYVTLTGTAARFPALDTLTDNCGTLLLLDGANIPRDAAPPQRTDGQFSTYQLSLSSVATVGELIDNGTSHVVVALVGTELHVRIFDAAGASIVDKSESMLISGKDRTWLKNLVSSDPLPDVSALSRNVVLDIIDRARSVSGYTDFFNRGILVLGGAGQLKVGGGFHQSGGASDVAIYDTGRVASATGHYMVSGGVVSVGPAAQCFDLNPNRDGFLPGTTIVVQSPFIRGDKRGNTDTVEITPVSVNIGSSSISKIDAGVSLTLHGREVTFPSSNIASNAGTFTISGDHGGDNRGRVQLGAFENTGMMKVLGDSSELVTGPYTQMGAGAATEIGAGSILRTGNLNLDGGEMVLDIQARPHHPSHCGSIQAGGQASFNDRLVINFVGDFSENLRPDVGDVWEIMSRKAGTTITGFENTTFRVNGASMPADWLPEGMHLELVQLPSSFNVPQGLAVRVAPDDGWILYDEWAKSKYDGFPVGAYDAHLLDYLFGAISQSASFNDGGFEQGLVEVDGREFYEMTYTRRKDVDATFVTYSSIDMEKWYPAPMAVLEIMDHEDGTGLETVILRSTFDLPDHRLFLQVRGVLNLENAPLGLVRTKPITKNSGSSLRNFEQYLIQQVFDIPLERRNGSAYHPDDIEAAAQQLPYRLVPGRVLYFEMTGAVADGEPNSLYGGTAANGVDRDFIYQDKSIIGAMVVHAGFLNHNEKGIVKVTFIERQPTFIGSPQESPDGRRTVTSNDKTSEAAQKNELYSLKVEAHLDPFGEQ